MFICILSHILELLFFCKGSEDRFEDDECDSDGLVAEGSNPVKDNMVNIIFL